MQYKIEIVRKLPDRACHVLVRGEATLAVVAKKLTWFWMSENRTVRASRCGNNSGHITIITTILHRRFLAGVQVHRYGADLELVHKVNISGSHLHCELTLRRRSWMILARKNVAKSREQGLL
jgi:hypothetical protein